MRVPSSPARIATIAANCYVAWYRLLVVTSPFNSISQATGLNTRYVKLCVPIGAALMALFTTVRLADDLRRLRLGVQMRLRCRGSGEQSDPPLGRIWTTKGEDVSAWSVSCVALLRAARAQCTGGIQPDFLSSAFFLELSGTRIPLIMLPNDIFGSLNSVTLLAVPTFVLAGELLTRCDLTGRLTKLALRSLDGCRGAWHMCRL